MERTWLRKIREELGITTYEAAKRSGVSQSFYSLIEAGTRGNKLPVQTAQKIARGLGFDRKQFYENIA